MAMTRWSAAEAAISPAGSASASHCPGHAEKRPIVILGEATAYIDPENEAVIQQAVAKLVKGKTVIVIAHCLSTITDADQIFVIQDGRMAGSGTHKELLEQNKLYQEMWNAHIGAKDGDAA